MSRTATRGNGRAKGGQTSPRNGKGNRVAERQASAERIFADNSLAIELFGSHHANLTRIEQVLGVQALARGNEVTLTGPADEVEIACNALVNGVDGRIDEMDAQLAVLEDQVTIANTILRELAVPRTSRERLTWKTRRRLTTWKSERGCLKKDKKMSRKRARNC